MSETATHIKKDKLLEPTLRFKEFKGKWEKKTLGDVGKIKMCKRIFSNQTSEEGDIPFFKIGTFGKVPDAFITKELYDEFRSKYSFPKIGDILMSASGTLGRTVIYDGMDAYYQDSNIVWIDNKEDLITNKFLYCVYQIVRYESEGGTIQRLYNIIISAAQFNRPQLPEQEKIASFLFAVDKKIQQLSQKASLLVNYKKGVMQKLFSGELRFREENGNDYPDWEEKMMRDIMAVRNDQAPKSDEYPLMAFIKNVGVAPKGDRYNREFLVNDGDGKKYKQTEYGDFIYSSNNLDTGSIGLNKYGSASISPVYSIFQIKELCDYQFISKFLVRKSFINKMLRFRQGVVYGQWKIHESAVLTIKEKIPCLEEQQKIASFLSAIDSKIEKVHNQINQTQCFKKGLLQQMFVAA